MFEDLRLALEEKGIDYHYRKIDLIETGSYETLSSRYLKINPSGLVPTLVHEGRPIYESDDILGYIDSLNESSSLIPESEAQRNEVSKWLSFALFQVLINGVFSKKMLEHVFRSDDAFVYDHDGGYSPGPISPRTPLSS